MANPNSECANDELTLEGRIRIVIKDSGLSMPKFAARTGVSKNTLINYRDGATMPAANFISALCEVFNVRAEWILLGKGQPYNTKDRPSEIGEAEVVDAEIMLLPLVTRVRIASGQVLFERQREIPITEEFLVQIAKTYSPDKTFGYIDPSSFNSMAQIPQNTCLIIDYSDQARTNVADGGLYLVWFPESEISLVRRVVVSSGELAILSDNNCVKVQGNGGDRIIGKVNGMF